MQLKTFRGKTMAEALTAVKRVLGPDALIVHTRVYKVGGVMGLGTREEIEILASAAAPARSKTPAPTPAAPQPNLSSRLAATYAPAAPAKAAPPPRPRLSRPAPTPEPAPQLMRVRRRSLNDTPAPLPIAEVARQALTPTPAAAPPAASGLQEELGAIKQMVSQLLSAGTKPGKPDEAEDDPLAAWYLRLLSSAVSRELAERIVSEVRRRIGAGSYDQHTLRTAFRDCIAAQVPASGDPLSLPRDDQPRPRAVAIVGATGVGKTTTVAKLAAQSKLAHGARVALISCDTQRVGAIEQLRSYADIIGVPFRVAGTPAEMNAARAAFAQTDLILVDTPGLSPRDSAAISDLGALLRHADLHEVHLALTASGSESSLMAVCRAFAPLRPGRLLFTKLDEAVAYGVILSVAAQVRTQLSYLTTGPRIPEQIEATDPHRLADLIAAA